MIQIDSRKVKKGDIFVAVKGLTHDGKDYIEDALKRGAIKVYKDLSKENLGRKVSDYFGNPSSKIKVIGVTGTKGKTTTCHLIYHVLSKLGKKVGIVSTITTQGFHTTTPDIVTLNQELSKMVKSRYEYAVLEVSSHGIDQGRISGINFLVTVLTNIAPEHLDYHGTYKKYKETKLSFLKSGKIQIVSPKTTDINILKGEFNNINAETAVLVCQNLGFEREKAISALDSFILPSGRMEEINTDKGYKVFVDFAHTPDSLEKALTYLKSLKHRRLISVFGCAGLRDTKKRSKMGEISTRISDLSIFTSEDPRNENIFDILRSMKIKAIKNKYVVIPERGEAISYAMSLAKKDDIVAIFGKGHEMSMCYEQFEHSWNDKQYVKNILSAIKDISVVILAAGKGSRMKSQRPKVLRKICGRPMLSYTLENLRNSGLTDISVVVSFRKKEIMRRFPLSVNFKFQENPKGGTANATKVGIKNIYDSKDVLVINGDDSAFYKPDTIKNVINLHRSDKNIITFVSLIKSNPFGLGRVVRDKKGKLLSIIEEKDATEKIKEIKEVNDGLYLFNHSWLKNNINRVEKGPQGEYYLVDLIKMAVNLNLKVGIFKLPNDSEWHGINTPEQLLDAEEKMKLRLVKINE